MSLNLARHPGRVLASLGAVATVLFGIGYALSPKGDK